MAESLIIRKNILLLCPIKKHLKLKGYVLDT